MRRGRMARRLLSPRGWSMTMSHEPSAMGPKALARSGGTCEGVCGEVAAPVQADADVTGFENP